MLVALERRGVGHQQKFGTGFCASGGGLGEPEVFADHQADSRAVDFKHAGLAVGIDFEIATLVEHRVVRQFPLAVRGFDGTVAQHAGGVVDHRTRFRPTHHCRDAVHLPCDALDRRVAFGKKSGTQQQVFGWVAAQGQFGKQDQISFVQIARFGNQFDDACFISRNGADREIKLGEGKAEAWHGRSLAAQPCHECTVDAKRFRP